MTKEFESIVFRIAFDDAHDLLPYHFLLFTHDLARRCEAVLKVPVLLKQILDSVRPYSKVCSSVEVVALQKSIISDHDVVLSSDVSLLATCSIAF